MEIEAARAIATAAHRYGRSPADAALLEHVERVAASVPDWARPVAWLHEVLERTDTSEQDLLGAGLSGEELRALRLLSREDSRSETAYLGHMELIARAGGGAGRIARAVKTADLEDRRLHPLIRPDGWSPPYGSALKRLRRAAHGPVSAGAVKHGAVLPA